MHLFDSKLRYWSSPRLYSAVSVISSRPLLSRLSHNSF